MIDRFVLVGTSHSTPRWNPMKEEFEKNFNKPFSNRAVEALSIKTYFPRVLAIMDEFPNEKLYFIMERSTTYRWEQYLINKKQEYIPWDICRHEFWPKRDENDEISSKGKYLEHIFWYNIRKLSKLIKVTGISYLGDRSPPKKIMKSLLRFLALTNIKAEDELALIDALYINSLIKNAGHEVVWFIPQQRSTTDPKARELDKKYGIEHITYKVLFDYIAHKKYRSTVENLRDSFTVFPDGAHLNQDDWRSLIHEYFIPYFKNLNIPEK